MMERREIGGLILLIGIPASLILICYLLMGFQCLATIWLVVMVVYFVAGSIVIVLLFLTPKEELTKESPTPKPETCSECGSELTWLEMKKEHVCYHCEVLKTLEP